MRQVPSKVKSGQLSSQSWFQLSIPLLPISSIEFCLPLSPWLIHVVCRLWCHILRLRFLLYVNLLSHIPSSSTYNFPVVVCCLIPTWILATQFYCQTRRTCPVHFIRILLILWLSWIICFSLITLLVVISLQSASVFFSISVVGIQDSARKSLQATHWRRGLHFERQTHIISFKDWFTENVYYS